MVDIHFDIGNKGHTQVINVCDTLSHVDTLMCQIWYDYVKGQKSCALNTLHLIMTHPCAKYGKPMSEQFKVMGQT